MGRDMQKVDLKREHIGLGFVIDNNVGNYTKNPDGKTQYLETLIPWEYTQNHKIELLVDIKRLKKAIKKIPDLGARAICEMHLSRLLALFEEEKIELEKERITNLKDCGPGIKTLEEEIRTFESEHDIDVLFSIQTEEDAVNNKDREAAKNDLIKILSQIKFLKSDTDITEQQYDVLLSKYRQLSRAIGIINGGKVDHIR